MPDNMQLEKNYSPTYTKAQLAKFLVPSFIGLLLFLTPVSSGGHITIMAAVLINYINLYIKPYMIIVTVCTAVIPSIATLIVAYSPLRNINNRFIQLFNPTLPWIIVRVVGAVFMVMVYFKLGPNWIWNRDTGGVMLYDVGPIVLANYFLSTILLPLLTDYGLMEFIGTAINRGFTKLFKLPGRAAVDCLASWLSGSSIGIILTTQQYRAGYYTMREACTITTCFSIISISYAYILIKIIGLEQYFIPWYISVAITGAICAIIMPKIIPIRFKSNQFNPQVGCKVTEDTRPGEGLFALSLRRSIERASTAASPTELVKKGIHVASDIVITVYPAMMIIGCIGLSLVYYTPVFEILSKPLLPLLHLLQIPEAEKAAPALLAGIVDSIMPSILGAKIESEVTRFVLVGVAVNQIIFFTEVAIILLRANIGFKVLDLLIIYFLRVLLSLPILSFLGHLVINWM